MANTTPNKKHSFFEEGFNLPALEERILKHWKDARIIEKGLELRKGKKSFIFFEGPPGANGKPGIHHVLPRVYKDIILRFKTMQGYYVPRKSGWDTHGLPVEISAEKELGLASKKDIEKYGIASFNRKCRELVWKYQEDWEKLTERIGFWLDLKDPYITYESNYIESLWWAIQKFHEKKLLYKGHRVVPWCTRCGTSLSTHELAQGYKEVADMSVYLKFRILPGQQLGGKTTDGSSYILSWTTTPWTLPGNVALAVGSDIEYALCRMEATGDLFVAAKDLAGTVLKDHAYSVEAIVKGSEMLGLSYEPLFAVPALASPASYKVYPADFVTTTDGTGVVHTAVMYGEDDYKLAAAAGLPQVHTVDESGRFMDFVEGLAGAKAKSKETDDAIFAHLKEKGFFLATASYTHEYPFCWRCSTPLLYYARSAWFVAVSKVRSKMSGENKKIGWTPEHIRDGRFGEWLKDAKDWNFSRERYWGTPLPVWECDSCSAQEVMGSVAQIKQRAVKVNEFYFMRHGFSDHNLKDLCGPSQDTAQYTSRLTKKGIAQVQKSAKALAKKGIDIILVSPLERTKQTAAIVAEATGAQVIVENDLHDLNPGIYHKRSAKEYKKFFSSANERFTRAVPGGETWNQMRERVGAVFSRANETYAGKKILIVSHADPLWLLRAALEGVPDSCVESVPYPKTGEAFAVDWTGIPLSSTGTFDLHRPGIDAVRLPCAKCKTGTMSRVKEVVDVWYDSGGMPFAQLHYPFENKTAFDKGKMYPAEYICEAVDQTRGWFYTLLAVATLLGNKAPFKNVICLGHINDKAGQKMSKSKGNIVDPWDIISRYGTDAVRWYFFTVNPPGEPKNFDEQEMLKDYRKFHLIIYNSYVFYTTYANTGSKADPAASPNILDAWILAALRRTQGLVTDHLENYRVREAAIALEEFVDSMSRWYIRRSRRRLQKGTDKKDFEFASATLGYALSQLSVLMAPFTPFYAEALYLALAAGKDKKASVHFASWPKASRVSSKDSALLLAMEEARNISSSALALRAASQIKVRQPLASLSVANAKSLLKGKKELLEIVKDEVNVKEVLFGKKQQEPLALDTQITPELKEEGIVRDFVRSIQELRAKANLHPKDKIILMYEAPGPLAAALQKNESFIKKEVGAASVEYRKGKKFSAEAQIETAHGPCWIALRK